MWDCKRVNRRAVRCSFKKRTCSGTAWQNSVSRKPPESLLTPVYEGFRVMDSAFRTSMHTCRAAIWQTSTTPWGRSRPSHAVRLAASTT